MDVPAGVHLVGDRRRKLRLEGGILTAGLAAAQMAGKLCGLARFKRTFPEMNPGTRSGMGYHFVTTFSFRAVHKRL